MAKQYYKAVYFKDYPASSSNDKSVTVAFSEPEVPYYKKVKNYSSQEVKELIGVESYQQLSLFAETEERSVNQVIKRLIKQNLHKVDELNGFKEKDVTFSTSKEVPFQRWYPYIEGYGLDFVTSLINNYGLKNGIIYDPFAGTGTTLFASDNLGLSSVYSEVNPLLQFLVQTKIRVLKAKQGRRKQLAKSLKSIEKNILKKLSNFHEDKNLSESYKLFNATKDYFPQETKSQVLKLRTYLDVVKLEDELLSDLLTVAVLSCLLKVSYLKKAGDVRFKTPKEIDKEMLTFEDILPQKIADIAEDISRTDISLKKMPELILSNAKNIGRINELKINAIITSPPYLNGTNYFRNTKIELWFLRYLKSKNDLRIFRDQALTSGINDVKKGERAGADIYTKSTLLKNTIIDLDEKAYDSRIPIMAANYFQEMHFIFQNVRKYLTDDAKILIDIGDSIFAGVHIKTDEILVELLNELGYDLIERKILRKRRSRNQQVLVQVLIAFEFKKNKKKNTRKNNKAYWRSNWNIFTSTLPHQELPFSKRNWGHANHSMCSYQGKLKPAIAHHLVNTFVPENGVILDPFAGVGTIPFEAALNGIKSYGIDISLPAYYISSAKTTLPDHKKCLTYIRELEQFIRSNKVKKAELNEVEKFGFNKKIIDYYEENTLKEILLARRYFKEINITDTNQMLVLACLLHILHGNRPYALSRRSHPIVPYAPKGEFEYKSLITKLIEKTDRTAQAEFPLNFQHGKIFNQDCTQVWPQEINNLDAVITSPPFFDSTRFYLANWIRLWFSGWSEADFKYQTNSFVEEKQKENFDIYKPIFRQAKERLKDDGVFVLHLGKSVKCDMAKELQNISKRWFKKADLFDESVAHCESHGIRDKGTVTSHQYLILN